MATDYDDLIAQIDASTGDDQPVQSDAQVPFRFRDTSNESAMDSLRLSGQNNMNSLMAITKDPAKTFKAIGMLFTEDGIAALGDYYKQSYGSPQAAFETAKKDPVGFLSDVALIGTPMRVAGSVGNLPKLNAAGAVVENLAPGVGAIAAARSGVANVASAIPKTNPEQIYENLLKMPVTPTSRYRKADVREGVIDTLLSNQISPNGKGLDKLNSTIQKMSGELDAIIDAADMQGVKIPVRDFYSRLREMRAKKKSMVGYPEKAEEVAQIEQYIRKWVKNTEGKREFTPSEARAIRQEIDSKINWNQVPTTEPPMVQQIRKEAAHGVRSALAESVPEAQAANREISRLLDAAEPLERATRKLGNNNQTPLQNLIGSTGGMGIYAAGTAMENAPVQIYGAIQAGKHFLWTPQNKARAAQVIYQDRDLSNPVKRNMIRLLYAQGTTQAGRVEEQSGTEQ